MKFLIVLAALVALAVADDSRSVNPTGCGRRPFATKNKIVGGQQAVPGDWGWQIALIRNGAFICGGSLINNQWILTAAHCVYGATTASYSVLIGAHNRQFPESGSLRKTVTKVIYHESYLSSTIKNDVALLKLDSPVSFNDRIVPICLDDTQLNFEGAIAYATGYGATSMGGSSSATKQVVAVNVLPASACTAGYGTSFNNQLEVCAGVPEGGKDACQGDSGGPLVAVNPRNGNKVLVGVTSWGRGCALRGYPGIYARVSTYMTWVRNTIARN